MSFFELVLWFGFEDVADDVISFAFPDQEVILERFGGEGVGVELDLCLVGDCDFI